MSRKVIDVGVVGNDGTGDSIRDSFRKVNDNFRELYSSLGLGEKLTFIGLDDTPLSYAGQNNPTTGSTPVLTINNTESGLAFKNLVAGTGISIDYITDPDKITINSDFAEISSDPNPKLGGDLSAIFGTNQYRIKDLTTPVFATEAVNKTYADTKVSRAGVNTVDPATGLVNSALGTMSGPLILSRSPEPEDDQLYDGLIAATKSYVDNSAFGSSVNLYVATSGSDDYPGLSKEIQGRALAYAYRTLEAALKRAEELVLEGPAGIGPYKKILTFNNGAGTCTLDSIGEAPGSGSGFIGVLRMSVDTATLNGVGTNYYPGDILSITGGTGTGTATIQVLTTLTTPGAISTFRIISTGVYTALPGATAVATTISTSAAPVAIGAIGAGATFNLTYKVASVTITNGGTGYSLVSVRITGGSGTGAFGTAVVTGGVVTSITITDKGSGFISMPLLEVSLPRFKIRTDGYRTDFTGDVLTNTSEAIRGRDLREGLFLQGETSGALAQILAHSGALDSSGNEIFDIDVKFGTFVVGEVIGYGDISKTIQISILVESGEYYENYPLKVPQNCSIVGDEFRRCIIRPRPGISSSPWAFQKFRRDLTIDGLTTATKLFAYHYLSDTNDPVYPPINNSGNFDATAALLDLNRTFLKNEVIAWITSQVATNTAPFTTSFTYNATLCERDVGLILDAMIFDLKWGEYNRTVSAALKYYQSASGLIAISTQLSQTLAAVTRLNTLVLSVIANTVITPSQTAIPQTVDLAYVAEVGSSTVINLLFTALKDIIDESGPGFGSVNQPKNNEEMDVFLANDAVRWQAITAQGHGGFMGVLDPNGQILAKSPYFQECASFSRSKNTQVFAGGMFVDGFTGNLQFRHTTTSGDFLTLGVTGLARFPQLPCSFLVDDSVFRINYVRDFVYNPAGSTANLVLDDTNPFTRTAGAQTLSSISFASPAVFTRVDHRLQSLSTLVFSTTGVLPGGLVAGQEYYVVEDGLTNNTFNVTATFGSTTKVATTSAGTGVHSYQRLYEILMPGNRSMLCNDFTQINDLGYGICAINGGLVEAVSMFTYYCHISYYSLNGAQIRSVGGSSAHGNYALVAEGFDPLEVPTPTSVFEEFAQKVKCYFPNSTYENTLGGLFLYVHGYDYLPLNVSELEIDHGGVIFRYPITSITQEDSFPAGVVRLNLTSGIGGASEGLYAIVADNTVMTLRNNGQLVLTGGLEDVAVRPSTGLKLRETGDVVYRVLLFSSMEDTNGPYPVSITNASPAVIKILVTVTDITDNLVTTQQNHKLKLGDKFIPTSTANGFVSGTTYYVITVPEYNQFTVSTSSGGATHSLTNGSGLTIQGVKTHKLIENYTISFRSTAGFTATISGTTLTIVSLTFGTIAAGMTLTGVGITAGTTISSGSGSTWTINNSHTIPSPLAMTLTGAVPTGITAEQNYYVLSDGLTDTEFQIAATKNGVATNTTSGGLGTFTLTHEGLTKTNLRENYDYVELTLWQPGVAAVYNLVASDTTVTTNLITLSTISYQVKPGMPIVFAGTAFGGITAATTYYVLSSPYSANIPVSTVARSGFTATIVTSVNHGLASGQTVNINTTATALDSDNAVVITVSDAVTFTYTSGVSGTILVGAAVAGRVVPDSKITVSATQGGSAVTLATASGTMTAIAGGELAATISIASPAVVTATAHGFEIGDVIRFVTTGTLPAGLTANSNYFVITAGLSANSFRISSQPGGAAIDTSGTQSGTNTVSRVQGRAGDTTFPVVAVPDQSISRVTNAKFMFKGEEYVVAQYDSLAVTNTTYARLYLNRPLVDGLIAYSGNYTIRAAVPIRTNGALGNLTIRISLTRVTSHDLLEIGTGSYADTNYPKEIYGPSVNALNEDTEVDERDVGRVFYVTTDQYGNFSVGPYFKVDQGTGTVTFAASIALSNLDGIGFKRGVTVSEFSTDSGFTDNATDTVPTENAARIYIERRLGLQHDGSVVVSSQLIPSVTGGFLALNGTLSMKGSIDMANHNIVNLLDPTGPQDVVNLRSLTFNNFQDVSTNTVDASDILVFTGAGNNAVNATVTGDITFDLRTGVDSALNTIDVQINANTIVNTDINSAAAIDQAKLNLDNAYATVVSEFTGATATGSGSVATLTFSSPSLTTPFTAGQRIVVSGLSIAGYNGIQTVTGGTASTVTYASTTTGSASGGTIRPLKGISAFDTTQFTVTNGFVTLATNGVAISRLEQIGSLTVLGNSSLGTSSVSQVAFSTVVNSGGAVKKSQYSSTGFLRRTNGASSALDGDYTVVEAASGSSASVEVSKIVIRDSNGDFGGRTVDISQLKMDTKLTIDTAVTATGGYIRYYGYDTAGGILISNGSLAADKATGYWNNAHNFKTQNGASDAPISCSQIQTLLLTTGASATLGDVTGDWRLTAGSKLQATYSADLAEWYTSDKKHEPGTVLVFGGDAETTTTNVQGDTRVAGVVSTDPAYVLNGQLETVENAVCVALQGRVPCRVVGKIKKGQILITSKIPGVAVAGGDDIKVGTVVGKALADYDSDHIGTIEIAVGRT